MSERPPAKREKWPSLLFLDWHVLLRLHLFMSGQAQRVYCNKWKRANNCGYYEKQVHLFLSVLQWFSPPTRSYMSPYILPRADGNNDSIFVRNLAKASTLAHASARKWVRPHSSLLLLFVARHVWGLSLHRCASFHQSQMEVHKKSRLRIDGAEFYTQFSSICCLHNRALGKSEGTKTITPLLHLITYCVQMDRVFFLFILQTNKTSWMKMLTLFVCGVLMAFLSSTKNNWFQHIDSHSLCVYRMEGWRDEVLLLHDLARPSLPPSLKITRIYSVITHL